MRILPLIFAMLFGAAPLVKATSASHWHIAQLIPAEQGGGLALIETDDGDPLVAGDVLVSMRSSRSPGSSLAENSDISVETGQLKVVRVDGGLAFAAVLQDGTSLSKRVFAKFPGIMAGDLLARHDVRIEANLVVSPKVNLLYDMIFEDPNASATTFELSAAGKRALGDALRPLMVSKLSRIMIQGFTDAKGPADLNQIESYQRAMTVRQFMVNELGFDSERAVALGLGESEPLAGARVTDSARRNRRIVIMALPETAN